jgi:hypothetical protein
MTIFKKQEFYSGGKNGTYNFPKNSIQVEKEFIQFNFIRSEVEEFFKNNKRCKSCVVILTEEEIETKLAEEKIAMFRCVPIEVKEEIEKWDTVSKSPYSESFYNSKEISWGSKPEGSLRISDHWNFESNGSVHCKINTSDEYIGGIWILARYENGTYIEIKRF